MSTVDEAGWRMPGRPRVRRAELTDRSEGRRTRTWLAAADAWLGEHGAFDGPTWPQGRDEAYADWRAVLTTRLDQR